MKITPKPTWVGIFGLALVVILLIAAGPLLLIWSMNTLFPALAIPYTIWTWLAALILGSAVAPKITKRD